MDRRWHDKIFVVDAEDPDQAYGIAGGQNIANEYFRIGNNSQKLWRDQDVVIRGPITRDLAKAFDNNFSHFEAMKKTHSIDTNAIWDNFIDGLDSIDPAGRSAPTISEASGRDRSKSIWATQARR